MLRAVWLSNVGERPLFDVSVIRMNRDKLSVKDIGLLSLYELMIRTCIHCGSLCDVSLYNYYRINHIARRTEKMSTVYTILTQCHFK